MHVFSQTGVMFGNDSDVTPGGFYFSTFFGGMSSSYITPCAHLLRFFLTSVLSRFGGETYRLRLILGLVP